MKTTAPGSDARPPPRPSDPADDAEPAIVHGSREQLLYLLAEAAEIEHTLMCSYLYAAFSLKRRGDPGLGDGAADAVERWRAAIMDVAVQEMGHLVIVANLTVALGGRPHFGRPNFPVAPGYFPSGVVVRLSGFSFDTLDHFIYLERPQGFDDDDGASFEQPDYARGQRVIGLMPSAQDYATIGHLYRAVRTNVDDLVARVGEDGAFIGSASAQVGPDVMDLPGVAFVGDLAAAHAAIDTIVDQGEGSDDDREDSHYRAFRAIRDEYRQLADADPSFAPSWPVADNPVLRQPPDGSPLVWVDDLAAASLLDFGCAAYGLLLRMLVQCFGRSGPGAPVAQKTLMDAAIALMHAVAAVGADLARLPASADRDGVHAGLSFTMLRGVEPLVDGRAEALLLREQLERLARGVPSHAGRALHGLDLSKVATGFAL